MEYRNKLSQSIVTEIVGQNEHITLMSSDFYRVILKDIAGT